MLEIVLYEPEIPPNAGNVMRLCANTGSRLHMVRPLGFALTDKQLERAGMDYRAGVDFTLHNDWAHCRSALTGRRMFAVTTRGTVRYDHISFQPGDVFVFGPETRGLPLEVLAEFPVATRLRLPMLQASRSLNLANAVAVTMYEAWRQLGFANAG